MYDVNLSRSENAQLLSNLQDVELKLDDANAEIDRLRALLRDLVRFNSASADST